MPSSSATTDTADLLERLALADSADPAVRDMVYSALFAHVQTRFVRLSRKMLNGYPHLRDRQHETDDVLQGAVPDLIRSIEVEPPRDARHLFLKAARSIRRELSRLARSEGRAKRARFPGGPTSEPADHDAPDVLAEWTEFHEQVEKLEDRLREVVDLRWYQGLGDAETGRMLGVSERTAWSRYREARDKLRKALGGRLPGMPSD